MGNEADQRRPPAALTGRDYAREMLDELDRLDILDATFAKFDELDAEFDDLMGEGAAEAVRRAVLENPEPEWNGDGGPIPKGFGEWVDEERARLAARSRFQRYADAAREKFRVWGPIVLGIVVGFTAIRFYNTYDMPDALYAWGTFNPWQLPFYLYEWLTG